MNYTIIFSPDADIDMYGIEFYIRTILKAPKIASHYMKELDLTIQKLSYLADSIGVNEYVQDMFGSNARHIIYKKIAIIFYCEDDCVYIRRVIADSIIH
jgi:hypothetical protein